MDSDAQQLMDAILAAPEDDAPRLVYADWLLASGDRLGELIVAQLEYARQPGDLALKRRVAGLISAHKAGVIGDLPVSKPVFRRGFIEAAEISAVDFLDRGAELLERLPTIRELVIWGERRHVPTELCHSPLLGRLRRVALRYGRIELEALVANPALAGLEALELTGCGVDVEACALLAKSEVLEALRSLELGSDPIGAAGLAGVGEAVWAPSLTHLRLWKAGLGSNGTTGLAAFTGLEQLELGFNGLDIAALAPVAALAPTLRALSLRGDRLGSTLVPLLKPLRLTALDLEGARIGDPGVAELARLSLEGLETLVLSGNDLTSTGVRRLAKLELPELRRLVLRHMELGPCHQPFAKKMTRTRVELDAKVWLPGRT